MQGIPQEPPNRHSCMLLAGIQVLFGTLDPGQKLAGMTY